LTALAAVCLVDRVTDLDNPSPARTGTGSVYWADASAETQQYKPAVTNPLFFNMPLASK